MSKSKPRPTPTYQSSVSLDLKYGRDLYPNGRVISVMATQQEWLDWAVNAILEAAKQEKRTP